MLFRSPLIKSSALLVDNVPLTLLGDHKQLSPVCEMPKSEMMIGENYLSNSWNLSSLFLEEFLREPEEILKRGLSGVSLEPKMEYMTLKKLTKTHRYGDNLAKILDEHIYKSGLIGNGKNMELLFIDSGRFSGSVKGEHESCSEADSVSKIVKELKDMDEDFAVITPFVKQRSRIISSGVSRDKVFTIHGSQGQEFDTIIFSPVSLHYHLTNTKKIEALYAINVAISRIKKRLVIVCDYNFWISQKGQLISSILLASRPYTKKIEIDFA